ncbi:hypothetical protein GCM10010185_54270 [Saccharothrix coeruleofusca]|uniref:Transposase n=1 Tax=Saccharothrix coeruleofusca TaxID=33919 RepID=A0A918AUT7_9PSEU|nr:hypothetical protein GCM10010185_54270 [Saccharothrix coeruleofusca]
MRVLAVDGFALRRGRRYATALIDAVTHRRVVVPPDGKAATPAAWLGGDPGVGMVCRNTLCHLRRGHPPGRSGRGPDR